MSQTKMSREQLELIFSLDEGGVKQKDIADIVGCTQGAVSKTLKGAPPSLKVVSDVIGDRYEYFLGDEARNTGNLLNGHPIYSMEDPTFDEAAFWEAIEQWEGEAL